MKKLITILSAGTLFSLAAYGQGTVLFQNFGGGLNAPNFLDDGTTKVSGPQYMAELFAGPTAASLSLIATTPFLSGAQAGYFLGGVQKIPTVRGGGTAFVMIGVWNFNAGSTLGEAQASGLANAWGASNRGVPFAVTTGNPNAIPPGVPTLLIGLNSFSMDVLIPEPPTLAFALLGAAVLVFRCGGRSGNR